MKLNFWKSLSRRPDRVKLVVGLGNPGKDYENSLHNVGFMCVSHFAHENNIRFEKSQAKARVGLGKVDSYDVVVARPQTFMNRSGEAVIRLLNKYRVDLKDLLVVFDDMDLPLGKIRVRPGGGAGGHKGMKSVITELGSDDFPRLRVGIGRPDSDSGSPGEKNADVITYLLSELPAEDKKVIDMTLPEVNEAIRCFLTEDITEVMNRFN